MNRISFFIRKLYKDALFSLITIGGFSLSLAVILILLAFIISEKRYDKSYPEVEDIYRMASTTNSAYIPEQTREMLESEYPEVKAATNFCIAMDELVHDRKNYRVDIVNTDKSFFEVFSIEFLAGLPDDIFKDPHNAVITESCAKRIFGNETPIGEIIHVSHREDLKIAALVRDFPSKTCLHGELFCSSDLKIRYSRSGHNEKYVYLYKMFVKLEAGADPVQLSEKISPEIQKFYDWIETEYYLEKFTDVYFNTNVPYDDLRHANIKLIRLLSALSLTILLLAVFHYVNLSIAESMKRLHEYGIRQVFGADRNQLIWQFFYEAILKLIISLIVAFFLAIPVKSLLVEILGKQIVLNVIFSSVATLIILIFSSIIIPSFSAIYISFIILKVQPRILVIKQISKFRDSFISRQIMILLQFAATIILIICVITISKQVNYVQNKELGYNTESLVLLHGI